MEICYLLAFPDADDGKALPAEQFKGLIKDAPYFQPVDIDLVTLGEETVVIEGFAVSVMRHRYDGRVQMVECRYMHDDLFVAMFLPVRMKIQAALQSRYIPEAIRQSGLYEEYSILLVTEARPTPDKWIEKNALGLARFIRSQRDVFDKEEMSEILRSRARYSAEELTLVDWEGSVIIAPKADFRSDIALLKIGNYQLLRYRMLDQSIEHLLDKINESFFQKPRRPRATHGLIRQIAEHRLEVMLEFERAEQSLLLIGDWYTAKLYETIQSEFYLNDWKQTVSGKLDNLADIVQTIKDNLAVSWENILDRIQLALWIVMLLGYLYLYFLDAGWIIIPPR